MTDSAPAYLAVFAGAVTPWFELFAIPSGISLGLDPVAVGAIAFSGNAVVLVAVVFGWERLGTWWERRRGRPLALGQRRRAGAGRTFERVGVPGLALQGPIVSGSYLAAIVALSLGGSRRSVLVWSLISVALWTVALVYATKVGVSVLGS